MNRNTKSIWEDNRYLLTNESQVINKLVKPILVMLGWEEDSKLKIDISDKSSSRCDIHLIRDGIIFSGLECKALASAEFSISMDKGDCRKPHHDGVVQLKNYCRQIVSQSQEGGEMVIPVLTNGLRWVLFNAKTFLHDDNVNATLKVEEDILVDAIITDDDFLQQISPIKP